MVFLIACIACIPTSNVYASNSNNQPSIEITLSNTDDIKTYCDERGIDFIEDGKPISKIVVISEIQDNSDVTLENTPAPYALGDLYTTVSPMYWTGSKVIGESKGPGPGTLGLSVSYTETATVEASFSYSVSDLSSTVGFSVSSAYTINPSHSVPLTSGQYATIKAYPTYRGYLFKKTNIFTGSVSHGKTYRVTGAEFAVIYR